MSTAKLLKFLFQTLCLFPLCTGLISDYESDRKSCPIWHVRDNNNGQCECGVSLNGVVNCDEKIVYVKHGFCMTWNNSTNNAELRQCPLTHLNFNGACERYRFNTYPIPINKSGCEVNTLVCKSFFRQGTQCRQCIDGYGPAAFSDGVSCAHCSKYRNLWVLILLFQLTMATVICLAFIPLQIKGTSSPLNIIITYAQMGVIGLKLSGTLNNAILCYAGQKFYKVIITILGVWNLDFFYVVFPPVCISLSFKAINSLLFEYVIAIYPLLLTVFIYTCIELHDRNWRLVRFLCSPVRVCFSKFHTTWNPKRTVLNTFATFLLLSKSKILLTSISLLLAVQSYNSSGDKVSAVLVYDPNIGFFSYEHIPYVILASFLLLIFVVLPALLLLLYPTRLFVNCLRLFRFRRWDILHQIMDIYQGWYKDGTEGTRDYRSFSALYSLLIIGLSCEFVVVILIDDKDDMIREPVTMGLFHILLAMIFFTMKPYKRLWMNHVDGMIFTLIGFMYLMEIFYANKTVCILGGITGLLVMIFIIFYTTYFKCGAPKDM